MASNAATKEKDNKRVKPGPKAGVLGPKSNRSITLSRDVNTGLLKLVAQYPTMTVSEYIEALILAQMEKQRKEGNKK